MPPSTPYDTIPYEDRPVAQAHPVRLFMAARRWGIDAAEPEQARVLELGCAHGAHLIPLAYFHPNARLLGVDLSARQIERGRARAEALGLTNVELRAADVMDLDLGDVQFDYIIAHGLFSWVPAPVQDRILALCRSHLSPHGVAYVSYNVLPGWGVRGAVRAALLELVAGVDDDVERIRIARSGLPELAAIAPLDGTAEGELIRQELEELAEKGDAYLLHEYLVPEQSAFFVRQFVRRAERASLQYLDDVAPTGLEPQQEQAMREQVAALGRDRIGTEALIDLVVHRQFRASLLVHAQRAVADEPDAVDPRSLTAPTPIPERPRVHALTRLEAREAAWVTTPEHTVAELDGFHAALIDALDGTRDRLGLAQALLHAIDSGTLRVGGPDRTHPSSEQLREALPPLIESALQRLARAGLLTPDPNGP